MKIEVENISKRFGRQTIIKQFSYHFLTNEKYVITGANGSGKSTLLKMLSGYLSPDSGKIDYFNNNQGVTRETINDYVSYAAPYVSIPEDLTVKEAIQFQEQFKKLAIPSLEIITTLQLPSDKQIAELSSGMKQRLHLGLAFFTEAPLLLLDEPTSFLDKSWKLQFQQWIAAAENKRTIILCSNDEEEHVQFSQKIAIQ